MYQRTNPLGTRAHFSIYPLPTMYSCTHLRAKSRRILRRLRSETPACGRGCKAKRRIARWSNPPFLRHCVPSKGLTTEHRHPDRSPGTPWRTVFFCSFSAKEGNAFHMARRRQEPIRRRDRDMEWRRTSHFLPWMVK